MDVKTREKSLVVSKGNYKSFLELATRGPSPYYDSLFIPHFYWSYYSLALVDKHFRVLAQAHPLMLTMCSRNLLRSPFTATSEPTAFLRVGANSYTLRWLFSSPLPLFKLFLLILAISADLFILLVELELMSTARRTPLTRTVVVRTSYLNHPD